MDDAPGELRGRFKAARKARGMSQRDVADAAGVSLPTVNNFERGVSVPQYEKLVAILRAVGLEEGEADTTWLSYSEDVRNFLRMMGAYLSSLPEDERYRRMGELTQEAVRPRGERGPE